ncbi:MAG TPA: inorganic diphosphatase [Candidatus Nanoarchaeia archaeon]|nr:inorganic diphosphatase [Candidatus Nanoarchaeia archaeon]
MTANNPWHTVGLGDKSPEIVNAIIEIPKNSKLKYELDKKSGLLKLDRFLYAAVHYPGDYGFLPQTLWFDGDPIDIVILTSESVVPMTLAEVRIIGVMRMLDGDERDEKLIGVYNGDPRCAELKNISDIPRHQMTELKHFFETYKELQGKKCKILEIAGRREALQDIRESQKMYKKMLKEQA